MLKLPSFAVIVASEENHSFPAHIQRQGKGGGGGRADKGITE